MAGKYLSVYLHLVWSTKGRRNIIDPQWQHRLHSYMDSIACSRNAGLIEIKSRPDHVHSYISLPSTVSIADLVNALKANSTRWIRQTFPSRRCFAWQEGYAAFSVSRSDEHAVVQYIRDQDEHHKRQDFRAELLDLLGRHGIEYDLRYVFD
jgi:REP element-mobilizing transposase RayT